MWNDLWFHQNSLQNKRKLYFYAQFYSLNISEFDDEWDILATVYQHSACVIFNEFYDINCFDFLLYQSVVLWGWTCGRGKLWNKSESTCVCVCVCRRTFAFVFTSADPFIGVWLKDQIVRLYWFKGCDAYELLMNNVTNVCQLKYT